MLLGGPTFPISEDISGGSGFDSHQCLHSFPWAHTKSFVSSSFLPGSYSPFDAAFFFFFIRDTPSVCFFISFLSDPFFLVLSSPTQRRPPFPFSISTNKQPLASASSILCTTLPLFYGLRIMSFLSLSLFLPSSSFFLCCMYFLGVCISFYILS